MIRDEREFEDAVEDAIAILGRQPDPGPAEEGRLRELLAAIGEFHPKLELAPEQPLRGRLDALALHLDSFQKRWAEEHPQAGPHWSTGVPFPG